MQESPSKAVLLVNLGSPNSYEVKDVKPYLEEFPKARSMARTTADA